MGSVSRSTSVAASLLLLILSTFALCMAVLSGTAFAAEAKTKCYAVDKSNLNVFSSATSKTSSGILDPSKELSVLKLSSNGKRAKVEYSIDGSVKKGWILVSAIMPSQDGHSCNLESSIDAFKMPKGDPYGRIAKGKRVLVLGSKSGYKQIRFKSGSVYKLAWVKSAKLKMDDTKTISSLANHEKISKVQARLDKVAKGKWSYKGWKVTKVGTRFRGGLAHEQCKGYAKTVFYICFKTMPSYTLRSPSNHKLFVTDDMKWVGSISRVSTGNAKSLFTKAKPGDFIQIRRLRGSSHSAIVYSVDSKGITFLEANMDGRNGIQKNTYRWSDLKAKNRAMSLYTATKYK